MKIYTSRYGNKEIAQTNLIPVGISLYPPRWETAFKVKYRIKELAPTRNMLDMEYEPYKTLYIQKLNTLDINQLEERFKVILGEKCKDIVLLCFEDLTKPGEWCHRCVFAEWWQNKTGQKINELNLQKAINHNIKML